MTHFQRGMNRMFYKNRIASPGPTPVLDEASAAAARPLIHHRSLAFQSVMKSVYRKLRTVFLTRNPVLVFTCSGTGAMEAAVTSLSRTDRPVLVIGGGKFAERWADISRAYGIPTHVIDVPWGTAVDPGRIQAFLKRFPETTAVFTTLTETSTCTVQPIRDIGRIVSRTNAILVVDGISGVGGQECRTDDWNVDVMIAGSQKALMIPPGLAFASVSPKARKAMRISNVPKFYFSFEKHLKSLKKSTTPWTPAIPLVMALNAALDRLTREGMESVFARHRVLAKAMQAGVRAMGLSMFSKQPADVATAVSIPAGVDGGKVKKILESDFGLTVGGGQDAIKGRVVRIGHMGFMDPFDILSSLAALGMALGKSGRRVKTGAGLSAAAKIFEEE